MPDTKPKFSDRMKALKQASSEAPAAKVHTPRKVDGKWEHPYSGPLRGEEQKYFEGPGYEFKIARSPKGGETPEEARGSLLEERYAEDLAKAREKYSELSRLMADISDTPTAAQLDQIQRIAREMQYDSQMALAFDDTPERRYFRGTRSTDDMESLVREEKAERKSEAIQDHNRAMRERLEDTDPSIIASRWNHPFSQEARKAAAKKATK